MRQFGVAKARLLFLIIAVGISTIPTLVAAAPIDEHCFAETGWCIRGGFLAYWQRHGGLAMNGYPLTGERREMLEDGHTYMVQYFERVRMEYHPENAAPDDVLLGQFGRRLLPASPPASPLPGEIYFPETGHNLGGKFLDYWRANGDVAQFGYPLAEEFQQDLEDGKRYTVQYFERARLEYHPENPAPFEILLGQFGRSILAENDLLQAGFHDLYVRDPGVRAALGRPVHTQEEVLGATQEFERGRMVYFGQPFTDAQYVNYVDGDYAGNRIYVLCGDVNAGALVINRSTLPFFLDTWAEGQDSGGGPGPTPDRFPPRRGFGKVWREGAGVRDCVGYARTAAEQQVKITVQAFEHGLLVGFDTSAGRVLYTLVVRNITKVQVAGQYTRYADPTR